MIEDHPFVSPDIRCGANTLALDKFGEGLGRTFEAHLLRNGSQGERGKNLAANLEAEIVPPLQVLGGVGKGQEVLADFIHAHRGYPQGNAGSFSRIEQIVMVRLFLYISRREGRKRSWIFTGSVRCCRFLTCRRQFVFIVTSWDSRFMPRRNPATIATGRG